MMLTPAEREEGRRLLERLRSAKGDCFAQARADWHIWCRQHADAIVAEPPGHDAIKRAAVREFVERLLCDLRAAEFLLSEDRDVQWPVTTTIGTVLELAAERGVNLNDKPA